MEVFNVRFHRENDCAYCTDDKIYNPLKYRHAWDKDIMLISKLMTLLDLSVQVRWESLGD